MQQPNYRQITKGWRGDIALNVSSYSQFGTFVHTSGFLREDGPPAVTLAPESAHTLIMFGALWPSLDGLYLTQVYIVLVPKWQEQDLRISHYDLIFIWIFWLVLSMHKPVKNTKSCM